MTTSISLLTKNHPLTLLAGALALSAPYPAFAETGTQDEIVVSALRAPSTLDQTGSAVTIITAETIRMRQYVFAADALQDAAGVSLARNGGAGAASSIRLRGAASGQTLVTIDGVIANDPTAPQGGFNFANLGADNIERIEVLRGPQSLLYGADAIGGVIAITTKKQTGLTAYAEGGSRASFRGGVSAGVAGDQGYARLSLDGVRTDGISRADGGAERDGYKMGEAVFTGGATLSDHWRSEAVIRTSYAKADFDGFPPPFFSLADTAETETTKSRLFAGKIIQDYERFHGALSLSYATTDRQNDDQGVETFSSEGDRLTAEYVGAVTLNDRLRLVGGGKWEETDALTSSIDESATAGAVFLVAEAKPVDAITLTLGARRDMFSNFEDATTARASAVWRIDDATRLRASWGEGFRAPSLFELNFDQFGVMPNPDLRPERATGFDIGFDRDFGPDRRGRMALTLFHTKVTDQIDFDFSGFGYFNIDSTRARGIEFEGGYDISPALALDVAYSFTDAIDRAAGAQLPRQPKHKGTATVNYIPMDRVTLAASLQFNGKENDIPAGNDSFLRLDLRAAFEISDSLEFYGRVENATDTDYQDVSGYGEAGISAFAGFRARL